MSKEEKMTSVDTDEKNVQTLNEALEVGTIPTDAEEQDQKESIARKIWLAGLGAYGFSIDQANSRYEQMNAESQKLFNDLVARGEKLQEAAENRIDDTKETIEQRIDGVKERVSSLSSSVDIPKKIDEISAKLDKISAELAEKQDK